MRWSLVGHRAKARSLSLIVTDDVDGSGDRGGRVRLAGDNHEIDLSASNRARLEKALAPLIEVGREAPRRGRNRAGFVRMLLRSLIGQPSGPWPIPRT